MGSSYVAAMTGILGMHIYGCDLYAQLKYTQVRMR